MALPFSAGPQPERRIPDGSAGCAGVLLAALRRLAPPHVAVGVRAIAPHPLFDMEQRHVERAGAHRRDEFATGRALLRELMGRDVPIPVGDDRAPVLPSDLCGALAHDGGFAVGAVGSRRRFQSMGIDIEPVEPLDGGTARAVLREDEAGSDPHLVFTLKEAAYKAWSGLGGRVLEHHDVRVSTRWPLFRAEIVAHGRCVEGAFACAAGRWLAIVVVPVAQAGDGPGSPSA
jgi:4'-phosphopantetheinyl transferase EntD